MPHNVRKGRNSRVEIPRKIHLDEGGEVPWVEKTRISDSSNLL